MSNIRPFYRKWKVDGRFVYGKFWGNRMGQSLMVSFRYKKVRLVDETNIKFSQGVVVHDRRELPRATKKQFEDALKLAQKKLSWHARQSHF